MDSITQSFIAGMNIDQQRRQQAVAQQQAQMAMAAQLMQIQKARQDQEQESLFRNELPTVYDSQSGTVDRNKLIELFMRRGKTGDATKLMMNQPGHPLDKPVNTPKGGISTYRDPVTGEIKTIRGPEESNTPEAVRTFEIQAFGKEVPELRGTPGYEAKLAAVKRLSQANPLNVYDNTGRATRQIFPNAQGAFEMQPGETSQRPPEPSANITEKSPDGKKERKVGYNTVTGQYDKPLTEWAPVSSQVINVNSAMGNSQEFESTAQLLAEGKINPSDISKRGGPGMVDKIYKRAREINPDFDPRGAQAENAAYLSTISMQTKQMGQMGSFVKNMSKQIDQVKEISKKLASFDARILNMPLRAIRGKIAGSADQAKYDMYITEIESEIGKLATGSSASISELSVGAQEKWAKIHDKNLSIKDMISLLEETKHAGEMRLDSVQEQLRETKRQRNPAGDDRGAGSSRQQSPLGTGGKKTSKVGRFTVEVE